MFIFINSLILKTKWFIIFIIPILEKIDIFNFNIVSNIVLNNNYIKDFKNHKCK